MTFTVPSGWVNVGDWSDYFVLIPDTATNRAAAAADTGFETFVLILTGGTDSAATVGCDESPVAGPVPISSSEFVEALASRAGLDATGPTPVAVGGFEGRQVDVALAPGWTGTCPDEPEVPSEQLWPGEVVIAGEGHRLLALDTGGGMIILHLGAPDAEFETFVAGAMSIVESFAFDPVP